MSILLPNFYIVYVNVCINVCVLMNLAYQTMYMCYTGGVWLTNERNGELGGGVVFQIA